MHSDPSTRTSRARSTTSSSREVLSRFTDAAAETVARTIVDFQREARRERELRDAQFAARMAELGYRIDSVADLERRLSDRLATLKDGRDGKDAVSLTLDDVRPAIADYVDHVLAGWQRPKDGKSVTVEDVEPVLRGLVSEAVARIPVPKDGRDGVDGKDGANGRDGTDGVNGRDGADGQNGRDADPAVIRQMIAEAVAMIPIPRDGRDGKDGTNGTNGRDGRDGKDGTNGKDVDPAVIRQMMTDAVSMIPVPKDGANGRDGVDGKDGRDGIDGTNGRDGVDGKDADPEVMRQLIAEQVAQIPKAKDGRDGKDGVDGSDGRDGKDADPELVAMLVGEKVREAVEALPPAEKGERGEKGEKGDAGPMGSLPVVDPYQDRVYYEGEACTYDGGVYQAIRDTGKVPGHADWRCIVARGMDGAEGKEGKQGPPGKQGKPGQRGERGASAVRARLSEDGQHQITTFSDGTEVVCDMYPVFSKVL